MSGLFADGYGVRPWVLVAGCIVVLGAIAVVIMLAVGSGPVCSKHQQLTIVSWVPIFVNEGNGLVLRTMSPIYGCVAS